MFNGSKMVMRDVKKPGKKAIVGAGVDKQPVKEEVKTDKQKADEVKARRISMAADILKSL